MTDAFQENILGATSLVNDDTNKISDISGVEEGSEGMPFDVLELPMSDEELLSLRDEYESANDAYYPKVKKRQDKNRVYLKGKQRQNGQEDSVISKNILFEATSTFAPATLAENPEPVVFSDDTDEGKQASNDLKTLLQYHADVLCLRQKLSTMVWQWSTYFIGAVKHGWEPQIDEETGEDKGDITTELRKPQNLVLDPEGYVDEFGNFVGWLGDRIEKPASWFIEKFPKHEAYISELVKEKLGTKIIATEWWNDEFCFTTLKNKVLDKHKNEFFLYNTPEEPFNAKRNHFAKPRKPFTFLSVYSLQEEPYDFTNLIEQNIPNQDKINDRDEQISKNLASANNAVAISGLAFNVENADQAVQTFYQDGFLLIPNGDMDAVKRIPASPLPSGVLETQQIDTEALRTIYGTSGLIPSTNPREAVRNNILDTQHDSTRIGGGVGDRLEVTAKNIFNWWTQLYAVFYDIPHYGAIMGNASAVQYVSIVSSDFERKFVVSVTPNSTKPKDEISRRNMAIERWGNGSIDPINLMKELDDPDPINSAKMLVMWSVSPQLYLQTFFPQEGAQAMITDTNQQQTNMGEAQAGVPPALAPEEGSQPVPDSSLSQVPINVGASLPA